MKHLKEFMSLFAVTTVVMTLLFTAQVDAAAKTPEYIRQNLRLGYNTAIAMDTDNSVSGGVYTKLSCAQMITKYYSTWRGAKLYNDGDGHGLSPAGNSASYRYDTWLSQAGQGNAESPMPVSYGAQDVPLQVNSLSFACRPFAKPVPKDSCGLRGSQWVASTGWFKADGDLDRGVHDDGSANYSNTNSDSCFLNLKRWQHTRIYGFTVSDGTINWDDSDNKLNINKDENSRFWVARPVRFNYVSNSQITASKEVQITMRYKLQNNYENGVSVCDDADGSGEVYRNTGNDEMSWSNCEMKRTTLTIRLEPDDPPITSTNELSCRAGSFLTDMTVGHPQTLSGAGALFSSAWPAGVNVSNITVTGPSNPVAFTPPAAPGYDRDGATNALTVRPITFNPTTAGNYTVSYTVGGSGVTSKTCSSTGVVGTKPYFEVNGGDIIAGRTNDGAAQVGEGSSAHVKTWNAGNLPNYDGGNTNLAVIATGSIDGVVTGKGNASLPALSFASNQAADYGGRFASMATKPSYRANISTSGATAVAGNIFTVNPLSTNGVYTSDHDITVNGTVGSGKTVILLVSAGHNVFVSGVGYAPYTLSTIPRLTVYTLPDDTGAGGNIVVSSGLSVLHGNYIAGGNFYTCGVDAATGYDFSDPTMANNAAAISACNRQLTLYGTISASKVLLGRTSGSYVTPAVGGAEIFNYGPETWMGAPNDQRAFDNYVSLPPIL